MPDAPTDINAFLDAAEAAQDAVEAPETPAPTSAAPTPVTAAAPAEDTGKIPDNATLDSLWKEVLDLRKESGTYRTERNQLRDESGRFTSAFDGIDDGDREAFLGLVQMYRDDPVSAGKWMKDNAEHLLASVPEAAAVMDETDRPLTRADYDQIRAEEKVAEDAKVVLQQVRTLGYDPNTYAGKAFMNFALTEHGGDLDAAHKAASAEAEAVRQKAVDEYLTGRKNDASATPSPVQGGGATGDAPLPPPKDAKEAGQRFQAYLEATA